MIFPPFKSDTIYALDLDGVLIDSIEECYQISILTYHGHEDVNKKEKELFFEYRGLVQPAFEFYYLMSSIKSFLKENNDNVEDIFNNLRQYGRTEKADHFERTFFMNRRNFQKKDFESWIALNPLTDFGKYVQNKNPDNVFIVTTKNVYSAKAIIKYYNIYPDMVYGNNTIMEHGSKGLLLNTILLQSKLNKMIFIDDAIEHLDTVENDNIKCIHATWGYSKIHDNLSYQSINNLKELL